MNESGSLVDDLSSAAIDPVVPVGCEQRVSDTLPVAVKRIAEELDPDRIIPFGSFAHGTATPDSQVFDTTRDLFGCKHFVDQYQAMDDLPKSVR